MLSPIESSAALEVLLEDVVADVTVEEPPTGLPIQVDPDNKSVCIRLTGKPGQEESFRKLINTLSGKVVLGSDVDGEVPVAEIYISLKKQ